MASGRHVILTRQQRSRLTNDAFYAIATIIDRDPKFIDRKSHTFSTRTKDEVMAVLHGLISAGESVVDSDSDNDNDKDDQKSDIPDEGGGGGGGGADKEEEEADTNLDVLSSQLSPSDRGGGGGGGNKPLLPWPPRRSSDFDATPSSNNNSQTTATPLRLSSSTHVQSIVPGRPLPDPLAFIVPASRPPPAPKRPTFRQRPASLNGGPNQGLVPLHPPLGRGGVARQGQAQRRRPRDQLLGDSDGAGSDAHDPVVEFTQDAIVVDDDDDEDGREEGVLIPIRRPVRRRVAMPADESGGGGGGGRGGTTTVAAAEASQMPQLEEMTQQPDPLSVDDRSHVLKGLIEMLKTEGKFGWRKAKEIAEPLMREPLPINRSRNRAVLKEIAYSRWEEALELIDDLDSTGTKWKQLRDERPLYDYGPPREPTLLSGPTGYGFFNWISNTPYNQYEFMNPGTDYLIDIGRNGGGGGGGGSGVAAKPRASVADALKRSSSWGRTSIWS